MNQIVRLHSQQEAMLDNAADRFIAHHNGDVRKALKEMMVLNAHLNDQLERMIIAQPGAVWRRAAGSEIRLQLSLL